MNRRCIVTLLYCLIVDLLGAQDSKIYSIKGDKLYKDSNYVESEEAYRKANEIKPEFKNQYNIANSLFQQGRTKEAAESYEKSLQQSQDNANKSKAFYNLGNAFFNQKEYDKSIKAYQEALTLNPKDKEAKQNLVLAKRQKQIQQQQQQQQSDQNKQGEQNKQEQQNQENNKDQKDKQKQDQQQEEKNKRKESSSNQDKEKDKNKNQSAEEEKKDQMNKDQAEQLLRMVDDRDKKIRERLQKSQSKSPKRAKDW